MKIIGLYLKFSFLLSLILTTSRITAQNLPDGIQYKITGRLLMDGGVYLKNPNNFGNGTEFNDLRIGVKATYQNWGMKLEMGYAGNKVAIKDAFATYSYKNSSIQIGQFYEPFSLDMICSTFDLRFNQSPGAVLALTNSRRMGVAYSYRTQYYYLCGGFFTDNDLSNLKNASQGYAIDGRLVYRPLYEQAKLIHIGLAAIHRTPDGTLPEDENRNTFTYKSPGVSTIDNRTLIQADVDHAASQFKIGTELLIYYHKFFLQGEYIRAHVKREKGFENYTAQGAYLQCSWLLLGQNYLYDEDQNGAFIIRNSDDEDVATTCDYVFTHFTLKSPQLPGGEVYLNGEWTYNRFIPEYRMTYNRETQAYEATALLKQGYYNYNYLFVPDGETQGNSGRTDGNFYETENEYIILVYHRPNGGRYDKLVGYRRMNFKINGK